GNVSIIEAADRPKRPLIPDVDMEFGFAVAEIPFLAVGQLDREGCRDLADTADQGVERCCG
ncbi:MAG: hypothetical protein H7X74_01010, partial [Methyloceanibacter sp.]|nr:hypothetical protein [Methyloceanibacter sp.]